MAKKVERLTAPKVTNLIEPDGYPVGRSLYVQVSKTLEVLRIVIKSLAGVISQLMPGLSAFGPSPVIRSRTAVLLN